MANTPFKLKSGNTTPFKQMGSTPAKHIALSHKNADHKTSDHKARLEKKWKESKIGKGLAQASEDVKDIRTDIETGEKLGTTKRRKWNESIYKAEEEADRIAKELKADKLAKEKAAADKAAADKLAADKLAAKEKQAATDKGKFGAAFRTARDEHGGKGGTFTWRGRSYHTGTKSEEE